MENRVSKLETHMEYVRRDLDDIRSDLKTVIATINTLPTRADLNTFRWQWVATAVAIIALTVGGIIGGLSWIAPDPAAPAPVVVTVPKT
jgi:hypothetical protein